MKVNIPVRKKEWERESEDKYVRNKGCHFIYTWSGGGEKIEWMHMCKRKENRVNLWEKEKQNSCICEREIVEWKCGGGDKREKN